MAKQRSSTAVGVAMPLRALTQRFAFVLLVLVSFGLMLLGKAETVVVERIRGGVVDVVAPILDVASQPLAAIARLAGDLREVIHLREENHRLREQNARLMEWHAVAQELTQENRQFRSLLNFVDEPRTSFVTARVVADSGGAFVHAVLVNAGGNDGVARGQAVVTGVGLAGRIATAGSRSSRALLITDLNSRIPVVVESSRERAILAGDNSPQPRLVFLPQNAAVAPGDRIVTSGHGGVFPPGVPVGMVSSIADGVVRVAPYVALDRLEHVRVVNYVGIEGVLATDRIAASRKRP
ncbi:MAG: rod shape-determining protein MreC [Rhodospirillales bacterium]